MTLSLIDVDPMEPSWGRIYQSGVLGSEDWDHDGLVVSMSGNENFDGPCLWVDMDDNEIDTLPYAMLVAFVGAITAFLAQGTDVLIHCNEGKYRSTYMDVAVHIKAGKMRLEEAFETIRARHPLACLRQGTEAQLRLLEASIKGAPQ